MITAEQLLEKGYRKYPSSYIKPYTVALYQRWIRDETTKFYAINFFEYPPIPNKPEIPRSFQGEVRFYTPGNGEMGFTLAVSVITYPQRETVEEIEEFFRMAYHALGCIPDPNNQP